MDRRRRYHAVLRPERRWATLAIGAALCCAAPVAAAQEPEGPPAEGLRRSGGFMTLSPAGVGVIPVGGVLPYYKWGIDGGYHLAAGSRFVLQAGAYFEHSVPREQVFELGAIARIGRGNERSFGYLLVRLGGAIGVRDHRRGDGGFEGSVGAGGMRMVHRIVGLGGEVAVDPGILAFFVRLRLFVTLKF